MKRSDAYQLAAKELSEADENFHKIQKKFLARHRRVVEIGDEKALEMQILEIEKLVYAPPLNLWQPYSAAPHYLTGELRVKGFTLTPFEVGIFLTTLDALIERLTRENNIFTEVLLGYRRDFKAIVGTWLELGAWEKWCYLQDTIKKVKESLEQLVNKKYPLPSRGRKKRDTSTAEGCLRMALNADERAEHIRKIYSPIKKFGIPSFDEESAQSLLIHPTFFRLYSGVDDVKEYVHITNTDYGRISVPFSAVKARFFMDGSGKRVPFNPPNGVKMGDEFRSCQALNFHYSTWTTKVLPELLSKVETVEKSRQNNQATYDPKKITLYNQKYKEGTQLLECNLHHLRDLHQTSRNYFTYIPIAFEFFFSEKAKILPISEKSALDLSLSNIGDRNLQQALIYRILFSGFTEMVLSQNRLVLPPKAFFSSSITKIVITNNALVNLKFAEELENLTSLDASDNSIVELSGLSVVHTSLKTLNLANNEIPNVEQLRGISSLTDLTCSQNKISTLSPLDNHTRLQSLIAGDNYLKGNWRAVLPVGLVGLTKLSVLGNDGLVFSSLESELRVALRSSYPTLREFEGNSRMLQIPRIVPPQATADS